MGRCECALAVVQILGSLEAVPNAHSQRPIQIGRTGVGFLNIPLSRLFCVSTNLESGIFKNPTPIQIGRTGVGFLNIPLSRLVETQNFAWGIETLTMLIAVFDEDGTRTFTTTMLLPLQTAPFLRHPLGLALHLLD